VVEESSKEVKKQNEELTAMGLNVDDPLTRVMIKVLKHHIQKTNIAKTNVEIFNKDAMDNMMKVRLFTTYFELISEEQ